MRRLLLLLLALLVPTSALAQVAGIPTLANYVQYSKVPKNRRVAVVIYEPANSDGVWNKGAAYSVGLLLDRLHDTGGAEVYRFSSDYFYQSRSAPYTVFNGSAQWQTMGNYFGAVLVIGMLNRFNGYSADFGKKFFCAESTNAQIVNYGGSAQIEWRESAYTGGLSVSGVGITSGENNRTAGVFETVGGSDGPNVYCTTYYGLKDTLTAQSIPYHTASMTNAANFIVTGADTTNQDVYRVVRLLKPSYFMATISLPNWVTGRTPGVSVIDSTQYERFYSDSIVHGGELIPWAWRTYWKQRGFAAVDTPWVDYVMMAPPINHRNCMSHVAWAVLARYIDLRPIKVAVEWDDVGNQGFNPSTVGSAWGQGNPRYPSSSRFSVFLNQLTDRGWKPLICGEPDTLNFYAHTGRDSVPGDSYYKLKFLVNTNLPFVNHVHDTTESRLLSNPMGNGSMSGFGGANGSAHIQAHAYSPGAWPWFGIYNRMAAMDSVTNSWHQGSVSPYTSFANDSYLSHDWRVNSALSDPQNGRCPPESMFTALAEAGKYFIRAYVADQDSGACANVTPTNQAGTRYFAYPGERFQTPAGVVKGLATVNYTGFGSIYAETRRLSADCMCKLMGFTVDIPRLFNLSFSVPASETAEASAWGLLLRRNVGAVDRIRILYNHPKNFDDQNQTQCEGYGELNIVKGFDALGQLCGHPVVINGQPWELP